MKPSPGPAPFRRFLSPAPWAAGLLFFAAALGADALPAPAGRGVPTGDYAPSAADDASAAAQPASSGTAPGFMAILDEQDARLRGQEATLEDQARRLSAVAAGLDQAEAALADSSKAQQRLDLDSAGLGVRVGALERKTLALQEAQASSSVTGAAQGARLTTLAQDLASLKRAQAAEQAGLAAGLTQLKSTRASLGRLDSMDQLLSMVKQDEETNDEELVEVRQALKRLEPAPGAVNTAWWQAVASWKYLPAVAAGLGVVAIGVAAARP